MYVIEGTWEEIERHKAELIGRHLRVTVTPKKPAPRKATPPATVVAKPKELRGYGMFAGLLSSEELIREKREETAREDRDLP